MFLLTPSTQLELELLLIGNYSKILFSCISDCSILLLRLWLAWLNHARVALLVGLRVEGDGRPRFEIVYVLIGVLFEGEGSWLVEVDLLSEVVQNELLQIDKYIGRGGVRSSRLCGSQALDFLLLKLSYKNPEESDKPSANHAHSHSVDKEIELRTACFYLVELMQLHALSRPSSSGE